jgi:hypothetical protein
MNNRLYGGQVQEIYQRISATYTHTRRTQIFPKNIKAISKFWESNWWHEANSALGTQKYLSAMVEDLEARAT